ncbi:MULTISPECIES: carboxymuconolactone decarboxylase family protein [Glycomyces]|uniref:4-carboxymuconolactone decarboxylase n=1 Tax=Glycomyces artemisiae TaxID=1076443 RepID=A0A2T0USH0_9ACTN|nr:carboxymuconolactone decarboxylase family protein [Glycomyces artemisiae]NUQ87090.1 carboxymuconolactone decarboxylase family protein [Glycomyces artemisiae]PRY60798.1 4-carboxymuconolactone decarboxylase [Glycomyces artemisiae]
MEQQYERGLKALQFVSGEAEPSVVTSLADIAPELGRHIVEFGYGEIYSNPVLEPRDRQLVTLGALAALGNAAPQLRFHINGALNAGCTREEVVEALTQIAVYAGFPAAINAMTAAREVFAARDAED